MERVWSLYRERVLGILALALISAYSFTAWFYLVFEYSPVTTFSHFLYTLGISGFICSFIILFSTALITVKSDSDKLPRRPEDLFDSDDRSSEFLVDPLRNALDWGTSISLNPGSD